MSNENEIFEIDESDIEMEDKEEQVEPIKIIKKQKTALTQDRIDKLREQLKLAREAKQKRKNGGKEPVKEPVSLKVEETPTKPTKKEVKPRIPKPPKVDKNELLLKELQALKMEIGSLKASKPVQHQAPVQHHTPAPVQHKAPVQHHVQVNHAVSAPIPIPKPVSKKPYSLFKVPDW